MEELFSNAEGGAAGCMLASGLEKAVPLRGSGKLNWMSDDNRGRKATVRIRNSKLHSLTEREDTERQRKMMELYDAYSSALNKYLRSLGLTQDETEDAIQETYLRLAGHFIEGGEDGNLRSWLFQVAHNLSMDVHRASRRDRENTQAESEIVIEPADPEANPERIYLGKERMNRVNAAMARLTPQQRSGVLLRAQGLRYMEIGAVLGVSESRAIYLVKRGLMRLAGGL